VLAKTNFSRATGVFFRPQDNKAKGVRISLATAILLAESHGMIVDE
jgi:hypothetical protein